MGIDACRVMAVVSKCLELGDIPFLVILFSQRTEKQNQQLKVRTRYEELKTYSLYYDYFLCKAQLYKSSRIPTRCCFISVFIC